MGSNQEVAFSEPPGCEGQNGALKAVEWYNLNDPNNKTSLEKGGVRPPEMPVFKPARTLKEHIHEMIDDGISLRFFPMGRSYSYWAGEDDAPEYILEHDWCDRVKEVLHYGWVRVEKAPNSKANQDPGVKPRHEDEWGHEINHNAQNQGETEGERNGNEHESDEEGESERGSREEGEEDGEDEGEDGEEYEGDGEEEEDEEEDAEEEEDEDDEEVEYGEEEEEVSEEDA